MEVQFYGANCLRISTKKASIVIDDNLAQLGAKTVTKADDTGLFTYETELEKNPILKLSIDQPGEYEISDVSVQGIGARAHNDDTKRPTVTIFKLECDDTKIAVIGHIYPELSNSQLEQLGTVDVLFLPVGGNGYTLSGTEALTLIKQIEPSIVVPTHYAAPNIKYPIPQLSLEEALKELAMEPFETTPKLKIKRSDLSAEGDSTKLTVLEQQ